jgi:hypothetical protein
MQMSKTCIMLRPVFHVSKMKYFVSKNTQVPGSPGVYSNFEICL